MNLSSYHAESEQKQAFLFLPIRTGRIAIAQNRDLGSLIRFYVLTYCLLQHHAFLIFKFMLWSIVSSDGEPPEQKRGCHK